MVRADETDLLPTVVKRGVKKLLDREGINSTDDAVDAAVGRIESITTNTSDPGACELIEFLKEPEMLRDLDTDDTPIISKGMDILLPDEIIDVDAAPEPAQKKQKISAFDVMTGKTDKKGVEYIQYETEIDREEEDISYQILHRLYDHLKEIGLGYRDQKQHVKLKSNMQKIKNTLCFVQKYWKVLLRAEFPVLKQGVNDDFSTSKFLEKLQQTKRKSTK